MGDAEARGHRPGVVEVLEGAAAAEGGARALRLVVELHRHADHLVALLPEQGGGHGGVDAPGHRDHDAHGAPV